LAVLPPVPRDPPAPRHLLQITVVGLKNAKGNVRLAICPPAAGFPDCGSHALRSAVIEIDNGVARASFPELAPGRYAVSVFHDANRNGRLDTFLGMPREGYGFSRNPPFRPRAPRFDEAEIEVQADSAAQISLRYLFR
jgi:uncharacterized protein (DUF2141 family)